MRSYDLVICVDLSGSTNGILDNVRQNIWSLVNQAKLFKPAVKFRIGIIGFSRPSFGKATSYVKILSRLTTDYESIMNELWKLKPEVEKGDQFVSDALSIAALQMNWSQESDAVKVLFLIGNGRVDTGSSDYRSVVSDLVDRNIDLIPVYCLRNRKTDETKGWNQIGRICGHDYESVWVTKFEPLVKPAKDQGYLSQWNKRLDKLVVHKDKTSKEFNDMVSGNDNKALLYVQTSYEDRLIYRVSEEFLEIESKHNLTQASEVSEEDVSKIDWEQLPDSLNKLTNQQLVDKISQFNKERTVLIGKIRELLPLQRQEFISGIIYREKFDTEQILQRVLLKYLVSVGASHGLKK